MSKESLENARLREALSQVGGFASGWATSLTNGSHSKAYDKLNVIVTTCKAALEYNGDDK